MGRIAEHASSSYINKMGDYCKGCRYRRDQRTGEDACPFNALYWEFHLRHRERLSRNPRIGMVYRNLQRMGDAETTAISQQAANVLDRLETL